MAIPREYATSNPLVRDALSRIPLPVGTRGGDFVAPDYPVDAEIVDNVTAAEHALNQDDLRAPDAEAKSVRSRPARPRRSASPSARSKPRWTRARSRKPVHAV
jgi:hypothetical protein